MSQRLFSKTEAEEKLGRKVEALRPYVEILTKTRGKIVLTDKTPDGYEVAIEWEPITTFTPPRPRRTWIGKAEYEEFLVEVAPD